MNKVRVAAGIIWRGERFLAAKRPPGKLLPDYWEFPGGKQEPGERIEDTLARELREELGIVCRKIVPWQSLTHEYPERLVRLDFMHVLEFSGEPSAKEGQTLCWVSPEEARLLPFLPADEPVIAALRRPGPIASEWGETTKGVEKE